MSRQSSVRFISRAGEQSLYSLVSEDMTTGHRPCLQMALHTVVFSKDVLENDIEADEGL
jgi:hypothetical protein